MAGAAAALISVKSLEHQERESQARQISQSEKETMGLSPRPVQTSPFFRLPAELRRKVYSLLNDNDKNDDPLLDTCRLFRLPILTLFNVCSQIRAEAAHHFFSSHIFKFFLCFEPLDRMQFIDPDHFASIQHIILEDWQHKNHPGLCYSRIELHLNRARDGVEEAIFKYTDPRCKACMDRARVPTRRILEIVESLERRGGYVRLTYEKLLEIFEAARFNFNTECVSSPGETKISVEKRMVKTGIARKMIKYM